MHWRESKRSLSGSANALMLLFSNSHCLTLERSEESAAVWEECLNRGISLYLNKAKSRDAEGWRIYICLQV